MSTSAHTEVYLGQIVQHVACQAYEQPISLTSEFRTMSKKNITANTNDQKKAELKAYISETRHMFVRLLVLIKWVRTYLTS